MGFSMYHRDLIFWQLVLFLSAKILPAWMHLCLRVIRVSSTENLSIGCRYDPVELTLHLILKPGELVP